MPKITMIVGWIGTLRVERDDKAVLITGNDGDLDREGKEVTVCLARDEFAALLDTVAERISSGSCRIKKLRLRTGGVVDIEPPDQGTLWSIGVSAKPDRYQATVCVRVSTAELRDVLGVFRA